MNELFLKSGYSCEIGSMYHDLEGDSDREIDIVATKTVNDQITLHLIVECKQSMMDKWIFLCNRQGSGRYYYALKHLPNVGLEILKEKKLFSNLHIFDRKIPLAYNYICYSHATEKKAASLQIDECVHKLPKALVDFASRIKDGRHIFLPIALFSGQVFAVTYKGDLVVEEKPFLQYFVSFRTESYRPRPEDALQSLPFLNLPKSGATDEYAHIRRMARSLGSPYQIDFVCESGLPEYLALVEKAVAAIPTLEWPTPTQAQAPA